MTKLLELLMTLSEEIRKAVEDGYDLILFIRDGCVYCETHPGIQYFIAQVEKNPRPCSVIQGNIYRIDLPDGLKGFAFVSWKQFNDE